jgi:hypothetical protein
VKNPDNKRDTRWIEEIGIAAGDLVATVKKLVAEVNVRRLTVKDTGGRSPLEIPLTAAAVISGALVLLVPVLAALGALAAWLGKVKIGIVRQQRG